MLAAEIAALPVVSRYPERFHESACRVQVSSHHKHGSIQETLVRYAGIDVASRTHVVAIVDEQQAILVKPTSVTEDAHGYEALFGLLGRADDLLVVMEATGHYHRNLDR